MDLFNDPTFWVAVSFVVFVALVFKPLGRAFTGALDGKIALIRGEVEEAQRLREEAQATLASYQRQQRDAGREAEDLMARAETEAEAHRKASTAALAAVLERQEQLMKEKIARAEAAAVQHVRNQAVTLAMAATAKLLEEKLTGAAGDALIDTAIGALPDRLH
ncbi:F0F1 ATP synthase subunit B [bacterium AH-315-B06]|nr:F0F1 ATP synthase subunit B [bacterium AH-315-B06]